jgi:hypothetical protein
MNRVFNGTIDTNGDKNDRYNFISCEMFAVILSSTVISASPEWRDHCLSRRDQVLK